MMTVAYSRSRAAVRAAAAVAVVVVIPVMVFADESTTVLHLSDILLVLYLTRPLRVEK